MTAMGITVVRLKTYPRMALFFSNVAKYCDIVVGAMHSEDNRS